MPEISETNPSTHPAYLVLSRFMEKRKKRKSLISLRKSLLDRLKS